MVSNIGRFDQILRIGISVGMIYIGLIDNQFIPDPISSYIIGGLGVINLIVAVVRYCPLYLVAGINTCQNKNP